MAGRIRDWQESRREPFVWLELEDFALRVFAGGGSAVRGEPARFAAALADAARVLGSGVVSVDLLGPHLRLAGSRPDDSTRGPVGRLVELLGVGAARDEVEETVAALAHRLSESADLVLRFPAPPDLLARLGADRAALSFDDLDDAAAAVAERLRDFAERDVAGILAVTEETGEGLEEPLEALEPVLASARHYGWRTALALERCALAAAPRSPPADLLLLPRESAEALADAWTSGRSVGGGLTRELFRGEGTLGALPEGALLYGEVPAEAEPEAVLERLSPARRASG